MRIRTQEQHQAMAFSVRGAMLTDVGCERSSNEDTVVYVIPHVGDPRARRGMIALVADGMGGHAAGEVASAMAAEIVVSTYYESDAAPGKALEKGFLAANRAIFEHGRVHSDCNGMGTTCTACVIRDGCLYLAHVGDSRAYMLRGTNFHQLSEDHSLVGDLVRSGAITEEEALQRPDRNVILRAIGTKPKVEVAVWQEGLPLEPGDVIVLCSDGLTDLVNDRAIEEILRQYSVHEACSALVQRALTGGGYDNVSVGVFAIVDGCTPEPAAARVTRPMKIKE